MNELLRKLLFLPPQASTMAREIDGLHFFVILTTFAGAAAVTLVGGYFLLRYKAKAGQIYHPQAGSELSLGVELGVVVSLLALFVLWWVIGFRQFIRLRVAPANSLQIYVQGKQWMWNFAYPDGRAAAGTLYVPAGRPVQLLMTSRDVIHSFYVPDFRVKQDVIPGRYTTLWFEAERPGIHDIFCAEYCGTSHSTMHAQVVVLSQADFNRWRAPASVEVGGSDSLAAIGRRVAAEQGCLGCHSIDGSPHIGPTWAGLYDSNVELAGGARVTADAAYLTESMMDPPLRMHRGYDAVMPTYQGRLSPADVAALLELIKSLRDVPRQGEGPLFRPVVPPASNPVAP